MLNQPVRFSAALAGCLGIACLVGATLTAQSPAPRPKAYSPPRTADGHPDLQGTFDAATMTPVERPAELGTRLNLTADEAKAIEQHQQERTEAGSQPSQADRAV